MRATLSAIFLVATLVAPLALADTRPPPPSTVVLVSYEGAPTTLAWSPVVAADAYVIYRGTSPDEMVPIATVKRVHFLDYDGSPNVYYGVATMIGKSVGEMQTTRSSTAKGDCLAAGTNLHVQLTVSNCLDRGH